MALYEGILYFENIRARYLEYSVSTSTVSKQALLDDRTADTNINSRPIKKEYNKQETELWSPVK